MEYNALNKNQKDRMKAISDCICYEMGSSRVYGLSFGRTSKS